MIFVDTNILLYAISTQAEESEKNQKAKGGALPLAGVRPKTFSQEKHDKQTKIGSHEHMLMCIR